MASNNKESYKVLNAELMAEVQKLRLMIAAYKRQVTNLVRENMGLREAQILQIASNGGGGGSGGQRENQANGVRNMMRRWKLDSNCLGSSSVSRPSKSLSTNCRRYGGIDIALEVSEEVTEIGRLKVATPPIVPTIEEDDSSSEEDAKWKPGNKDSLIRKIARSCWRRPKFYN